MPMANLLFGDELLAQLNYIRASNEIGNTTSARNAYNSSNSRTKSTDESTPRREIDTSTISKPLLLDLSVYQPFLSLTWLIFSGIRFQHFKQVRSPNMLRNGEP